MASRPSRSSATASPSLREHASDPHDLATALAENVRTGVVAGERTGRSASAVRVGSRDRALAGARTPEEARAPRGREGAGDMVAKLDEPMVHGCGRSFDQANTYA